MIKLFETIRNSALGARSDHPLANSKEAEEVFAELLGGDAQKSLEEITHWLESVTQDEALRPERRFDLIRRLDELAQPHRIKVGRDYGNLSRQSRFQEGRLWGAKHDFWTRVSEAYADLMQRIERKDKGVDALKPHHGLIALRALRACARRLKWLYVRYGPVPADTWATISRAYLFAETRKLNHSRAALYPGIPGESTPEEEFMRAMLLSASAPDALTPQEMDVCERVIAHFAGRFRVVSQPQSDSSYWFDLEQSRQPLRLAAPPAQVTPGLRFFGTATAHAELMALLAKLDQSDELPSGVDFGGTPDVRVVREVFKHLALNWAPKPPVRKSERKRLQARMSIAHGFTRLIELMKPEAALLALDEVSAGENETWVVENLSSGGFGATVGQSKGDWLKIGALIAVQPDMPSGSNGRWDIGIIRRLSREGPADASGAKGQASTGVQVLSRTAMTTALVNAGGAWTDGSESIEGIFWADPSSPGAAVLALPSGTYLPGEQIRTVIDGRNHLLFPIGVADRGDDYDLINFRDMVQDE